MARLEAKDVDRVLKTGGRVRRDVPVAPKFKAGDRIVVRNLHPLGHTRSPRYVRGHVGEIHHDHGVMVFPDTNAHFKGETPQHCYSVKFAARELWGPDAAKNHWIYVDLWDDHMDAAP